MMRYVATPLLCFTLLIGCSPMIRVDADTYLRNHNQYGAKETIITAELEEVFEHYELLQGKRIEIAAPITHFEERDAPSWYVVFEKDGRKIRGYEDDFMGWVPPDAVYLARWAKKDGGDVIARGKLTPGGMELDQLIYKTLIVNTNTIPT